MITALKLYAVLNEMQISKIPTVFEYDPELYQEGSTCICYRGFEIIQGNGQVERKTVMIKKLKDTSTDSEKRLQEAVKNRLEYAHVFEMARNGIAMDCGLFLDASELASSTSVYSIQQCFDGKVLSQIQPYSILYELNVIASAAEILQRLQEKGYIYGDVKADNLLVKDRSKDRSTEVMLFDLNASRKSVQIQQTGVLLTNSFCPDNLDFSERSLKALDSYMLSALLASRLLPEADNTTILSLVELWDPKDLRQHLNPEFEDIALISDNVAEKLLALLKKGMAVCSFDRYSEMSEFRHDLRGVIDILERIRTTQSVIAEGKQIMSKIELTLYPIEGEGDNNTVFVAKTKVAENSQAAPETPHTTNSTNDSYSQIRALGQEADLLMDRIMRIHSIIPGLLDADGPYAAYLKSAELRIKLISDEIQTKYNELEYCEVAPAAPNANMMNPSELANGACTTYNMGLLISPARAATPLPENKYRSDWVKQIQVELAQLEEEADMLLVYITNQCDDYYKMACLLEGQGELKKAERLYREAIEGFNGLIQTGNAEHYEAALAKADHSLACLLDSQGILQEAESRYREALKIRFRLARENPAEYAEDLAISCHNLACLLDSQGKPEEAEALYREAIKIYRRLAQKNPVAYAEELAIGCDFLADLLDVQGEQEEAKRLYREAEEIRRRK